MFAEEDWNDDSEARALSKAVFHGVESSHCITQLNVQTPVGKKKKKLLETLWNLTAAAGSDQGPRGTDSKLEQSVGNKTGKKNKRKKKRNRGKKEGTETVGAISCKVEVGKGCGPPLKSVSAQSDREKENKRSAKGCEGLERSWAGGTQVAEGSPAARHKMLKADGLGGSSGQGPLSRRQWRNRVKNKQRNRNKFRPTPSEGTETLLAESEGGGAEEEERSECDRTQKKSGAKREEDKRVTDRQKTKIKRKGWGEEGNEPEERTASQTNTENTNNRNKKRARDWNQKNETVSDSKRTRRKAPGEEMLVPEHRENNPGRPSPQATVPSPAGGVNGDESGHLSQSLHRSAALRSKMEERLKSARFRYINEQLYTSTSGEAQRLFTRDREAFAVYHRGFTAQLERWPENPLDRIIQYIRNRTPSAVVADFGCGDCKIARSVRNTVYSFDLVALNEHVTVCDMANVPLAAESVDIVVFCLALMGTNLLDFLKEASRVLKLGGILKIAEVASRFGDVRSFTNVLGVLGFKVISKDTESSYFYLFDFRKCQPPREKGDLPQLELKPCLYKKR
ncbi:uncharacterized protein rrp8 [Heptranchias perlo]|uniref:uncharacterized protein rrp8 n=1 Tax=Heptranchias perlo TaxID=212740 RepID=UPI00355AC572